MPHSFATHFTTKKAPLRRYFHGRAYQPKTNINRIVLLFLCIDIVTVALVQARRLRVLTAQTKNTARVSAIEISFVDNQIVYFVIASDSDAIQRIAY